MATYACTRCHEAAELETSSLGPWAAKALLEPLRVLCAACARDLGLEERTDGGKPFVVWQGEEFRRYAGTAYSRSDHPQNQGLYEHDQPHGSTS